MLVAHGRVLLTKNVRVWLKEALDQPGLFLANITPEIAIESCQLAGYLHGDPAARILVATARSLDATLLTKDERLIEYGERGFVRELPA